MIPVSMWHLPTLDWDLHKSIAFSQITRHPSPLPLTHASWVDFMTPSAEGLFHEALTCIF